MSGLGRRTILAGAGAALIGAQAKAAAAPLVKVGAPAPKFSIFTFAWKKVQFEELAGKVVILNFWATWCAPCRAELPELNTYFQAHASQGLLVYAVATEDSVPKEKLAPLASVLSFPLVKHLTGNGYGAIGGAVPTNYVIDRAGVVRYAKAGAFTKSSLEGIVSPLLAETAPTAAPSTKAT